MFYAKSEPIETIKEHTDKLLENLEILKNIYGKDIERNKKLDTERFWYLLKLACIYHDLGKVFTPFQNLVREKIGKENLPTEFSYKIKHEQLSPMFIPAERLELTKEEKKLLYQTIYYHHERDSEEISSEEVEKIIKEDIMPQIEKIKEETQIDINEEPDSFYLKYVRERQRITDRDDLYEEYCLLKGLLHRLDHSSSAEIEIEDQTQEKINQFVHTFMENKEFKLNDLQEFSEKSKDKNLLIIGSTGMGKTEASLLWSNHQKTFFTLPIRISINAIFDRIRNEIGYEHVGLLHGTALDYLEENTEFENPYQILEQSKNLAEKITTCTIDQIFPFVFKYKGYEKIYSTLSYSKIIIDEIQAYSPEIVAIILKGLQMINKLGGKFMIMTATLPRIYKEELEKMGIEFEYNEFIKDTKRHKIKIEEKEPIEDIDIILEKSKDKKVLIIANTINKAIEIYQKLQEKSSNINLLHSRFIARDRNEKENQIKTFSKDKKANGIWITTQIVEASLDIDFDYLFTEMSTLDSLFQRLGRCYRSREYDNEESNVRIYTKNSSGIKYVYDEEIYSKSIELLKDYDNQILNERVKIQLVDKLYSREMLEETKFLKRFEEGMQVLNNIIDYDNKKEQAQRLLRNIDNITVIPKTIYEENLDLFKEYEIAEKSRNYQEKNKIRREINKLTTSISNSQVRYIKQYTVPNPYIEEIKIVDLRYDNNIGLLLKKDEEYDLNDRML